MKKLCMYIMFVSMMSHGLWASFKQIDQRFVRQEEGTLQTREQAEQERKRLELEQRSNVEEEPVVLRKITEQELYMRKMMEGLNSSFVNMSLKPNEILVLREFNETFVRAMFDRQNQETLNRQLDETINNNQELFNNPEVVAVYGVRFEAARRVTTPQEKEQVLQTMREQGHSAKEVSLARKILEGTGRVLLTGARLVLAIIVITICLSTLIAIGAITLALTIVGLPFRIMGLNRSETTMFGNYLRGVGEGIRQASSSQQGYSDTSGVEMRGAY